MKKPALTNEDKAPLVVGIYDQDALKPGERCRDERAFCLDYVLVYGPARGDVRRYANLYAALAKKSGPKRNVWYKKAAAVLFAALEGEEQDA